MKAFADTVGSWRLSLGAAGQHSQSPSTTSTHDAQHCHSTQSHDPSDWGTPLGLKPGSTIIEQPAAGILVVIELEVCDFSVSINEGLLVDAPHLFEGADGRNVLSIPSSQMPGSISPWPAGGPGLFRLSAGVSVMIKLSCADFASSAFNRLLVLSRS